MTFADIFNELATPAQIKFIETLSEKACYDLDSVNLAALTKRQASALIKELKETAEYYDRLDEAEDFNGGQNY